MTTTQGRTTTSVQSLSLENIDDVVPLNDGDTECLKEVAQVLMKHNRLDRFGVNLLHDHFDLQDGEVLMEFCDSKNRCLTIKPVKATESINSIETMWVLGIDGNKPISRCYRHCWKNIHGNHEYSHEWGD